MASDNMTENNSESERMIFNILNRMGLDKINEYQITNVSISYRSTAEPSERNVSFVFRKNGTLELSIHDTSFDSGLKYALAKFAWEFKAQHIFFPHRRSTIPAVLQIATFVGPLTLYGEIALGDLGLSLLLGPALYAAITLPFLLFLTKKRQEDNQMVRNHLRDYLTKSEFYKDSKIDTWVLHFTKKLPLYHAVEYILFLPLLLIFIWIVFYLN